MDEQSDGGMDAASLYVVVEVVVAFGVVAVVEVVETCMDSDDNLRGCKDGILDGDDDGDGAAAAVACSWICCLEPEAKAIELCDEIVFFTGVMFKFIPLPLALRVLPLCAEDKGVSP